MIACALIKATYEHGTVSLLHKMRLTNVIRDCLNGKNATEKAKRIFVMA